MLRIQIGQDLLMGKGSEFVNVDLRGAKVGVQLGLSGVKIAETLNMNILQVGGNLFICEGTELGKVDLQNGKVDGQIHLGGAKFSGALVMNQIQVGDDLIIGEDTFIEDLALRYAKVRGGLDFSRAVIQGPLNLRGCSVEFFLDNQDWPKTYYINGFNYRKLDHKIAIREKEWFKKWLNNHNNQADFSLKSYELLARLLEEGGEKTKADSIRFEKKENQRRHAAGIWQKFYLFLERYLTGYGFRMWLPLWWVLALTVFGAFIIENFYCPTKTQLCTNGERIFFTLDTLLPIIELNKDFKEMLTNLPPLIRYIFYCFEILGWVIGSFLVAGLSGLTKK